ncbi:tetratricopeptide repeat protein [Candidatus Tisiphia endosymbiont of Ptychoptera albimana]|uniref:tetratricopeptide repeat protein n=1 Tax=Candidatus Tisiphia endosymbiont of Ptychoptera albimana TaxID=3066260 RepID=UPI00312CA489
MKNEIRNLLTQADSEKQQGNIEVATKTLDEAKNLLQNVAGIQKSNRNDTSGDTKEIIYLHKYGNILYGIEEYEQSLKYYKEIAEKQLKPKVNIYKALGDCLRKLTRYDEALEQYDKGLKAYKNDRSASSEDKAAVYNSIGLTYVVKAQNEEALKAFEDAINARTKNPNPLYYCNKGSILLSITGRKEEGLNCFNEAVTLVNKGKIEGLTKQNITYITEILASYIELENKVKGIQTKFGGIQSKADAEQLHELQEKYNKLQENHNELVEIVKNNTLKQEDHNELVEARNMELTEKMNKVATNVQLLDEGLQVVVEGLQVATENIVEIKEQLISFVTKDEFEKLKSTSTEITNLFDNKLEIIITELDGQKKMIVHIDDTLTKANVGTEVEIKEKFELLEKEYGSEVCEYATKFYCTLSDCLLAYKLISTGLIKGKGDDYSSIIKKISDGLGLAGKFFPPLGIAGGGIGVINGFYEKYTEVKLIRTAKKVADSISGFILPKDLDMALASSAIDIAKIKASNVILSKEKKPEGIDKAKEWLSKVLDKLELKITKIPSVSKNEVSKMVLEDVVLFIYSIVKSDDQLVGNNEDVNILGQKIVAQFKNDVGIKQLLNELYNKANPNAETTKQVHFLNEVVYDNPLLNNLGLMKDVSKLWGGNFNEVLKLSKELNPYLIEEAIENNDPFIVLGGLLSLADNSSECI